jgi:predicted Zn-dependent protease
MKSLIGVVLAVALVVVGCSTVPVTGRSQLNLIPDAEILAMSFQEYDSFVKQNKLSTDATKSAMVKRVGARIQKAVETYFAQHGLSGELKGYRWEFNLVEDPQVNAWCMPGGKVVVYTGILPLTQNEAGLAVVMGHEIAHAVAEHGNERMSQALLQQAGGVALSVAMKDEPAETRNMWLAAYGIGSQVGVLLPFSRTQESEADHLGLIFMAMAGYDPRVAPEFWKRMAAMGGEKPPEFLSTHPADETRIRQINEWMGEALQYYSPG